MKRLLILMVVLSFAANIVASESVKRLDKAIEKASVENKNILLIFSGSDWCRNCILLEKEVFKSKDFKKYAKSSLIVLVADFPQMKKNQLSEEDTKYNESLADKYNKNGVFPKAVIFNKEGKVLGEIIGHTTSDPIEYIEDIKSKIK